MFALRDWLDKNERGRNTLRIKFYQLKKNALPFFSLELEMAQSDDFWSVKSIKSFWSHPLFLIIHDHMYHFM